MRGENRVHGRRNEQSNDEQTGEAAAFGDQIGDSLNPLEPFRVKRVIPLGSQVVEIAGQICALLVSLRLIPVHHDDRTVGCRRSGGPSETTFTSYCRVGLGKCNG